MGALVITLIVLGAIVAIQAWITVMASVSWLISRADDTAVDITFVVYYISATALIWSALGVLAIIYTIADYAHTYML